jgi:hypothetical protein
MATGTSRQRRLTPLEAVLAAVAAGLIAFAVLSAGLASGHTRRRAAPARPAPARDEKVTGSAPTGAFASLSPRPAPAGWPMLRLSSGVAALAYPPGWRGARTDPGTATVSQEGPSGLIEGYLNLTPQSGEETLANWTRFRPHHVAAEGARSVQLLAAQKNVGFTTGRGSCVIDQYVTTRTSYREIACLVKGPGGTTVVVAAAQLSAWAREAPLLERSLASFTG